MLYVLYADSWWSQWEFYTPGAVLWGTGSVSQSMHHITVQLPLAQVQDRWIHIKPRILCQLLLYQCWWVVSLSYACLLLNTFTRKQRFLLFNFLRPQAWFYTFLEKTQIWCRIDLCASTSLIREYSGRNKFCARQRGWNKNFNQNMFLGSTSLFRHFSGNTCLFKFVQGSVWEASFI
jgi:hypothetical protein